MRHVIAGIGHDCSLKGWITGPLIEVKILKTLDLFFKGKWQVLQMSLWQLNVHYRIQVLHIGVSSVLRLFSSLMSGYISEHGVLFRATFTFLLLCRGSWRDSNWVCTTVVTQWRLFLCFFFLNESSNWFLFCFVFVFFWKESEIYIAVSFLILSTSQFFLSLTSFQQTLKTFYYWMVKNVSELVGQHFWYTPWSDCFASIVVMGSAKI